MTAHERDYFRRRAEAELECAQAATHEKAVHAHYMLAGLYLDRAYPPSDVDGAAPQPQREAIATAGDHPLRAEPAFNLR